MCENVKMLTGVGQDGTVHTATKAYDNAHGNYADQDGMKTKSLKPAYKTHSPMSVSGK